MISSFSTLCFRSGTYERQHFHRPIVDRIASSYYLLHVFFPAYISKLILNYRFELRGMYQYRSSLSRAQRESMYNSSMAERFLSSGAFSVEIQALRSRQLGSMILQRIQCSLISRLVIFLNKYHAFLKILCSLIVCFMKTHSLRSVYR